MPLVVWTSRRSPSRGSLPISLRRADAQRLGERLGEGGEQDARIGVRARQMNGAVEGHDRLAGTR